MKNNQLFLSDDQFLHFYHRLFLIAFNGIKIQAIEATM